MKDTERLNAIIHENFDSLAALIEEIKDRNIEDEDVEEVMEKYGLEPEEAVKILRCMDSARFRANAIAVKAADSGANAAIDSLGGIELDHDEYLKNPSLVEMWKELWNYIHEEVMTVEYKALAKI